MQLFISGLPGNAIIYFQGNRFSKNFFLEIIATYFLRAVLEVNNLLGFFTMDEETIANLSISQSCTRDERS